MSDGGIWQPPEPGGGPADIPVTAVELEPRAPAPRTRSPGVVIAAVVGGAAIAAGAVFGVTRLTSDDNGGGAATPEEAGLALLTALENEDVLGMIDVLLPGERETLQDPVTDLTDELRRLEVLSDEADLSAVSGVDLVLENESVRADATNVDDIVNLDITATADRARVDGEQLPIGDLVLDNIDTDLSELDTDASDERGGPARVPAHGGRGGRALVPEPVPLHRRDRPRGSQRADRHPGRRGRADRRRQPGGRRRRVPRRRRGARSRDRDRNTQPERVPGVAALRADLPRRRPGRARPGDDRPRRDGDDRRSRVHGDGQRRHAVAQHRLLPSGHHRRGGDHHRRVRGRMLERNRRGRGDQQLRARRGHAEAGGDVRRSGADQGRAGPARGDVCGLREPRDSSSSRSTASGT